MQINKCVYVLEFSDKVSYLLLFVDDILVTANSQDLLNEVKSKLMGDFKMRDLGNLKYFLGIKIFKEKGGWGYAHKPRDISEKGS